MFAVVELVDVDVGEDHQQENPMAGSGSVRKSRWSTDHDARCKRCHAASARPCNSFIYTMHT